MANFPVLTRHPGAKGFTEDAPAEGVQIAKKASGLPVVNKLFTFAGKTWKHTRYLVSQADKETYLAHYEAHKDVPFNWANEQEDDTIYEIVYGAPPKCKLDRLKNRWQIVFVFLQYS